MKNRDYLKLVPYQSEFSHQYACWANNHNGWSKMKKLNSRIAKVRLKQSTNKFISEYDGCDENNDLLEGG
ncbi:hypothetical protein [Chryseobacterium sp.]|uniref:hypothetical protein n=1 Tax=Chryseobacterium sp. TaxID=1871047 RepID=UPI002FC990E8